MQTIKVLQQRLADMKKTLQKELRVPSSSLDSDAEPSAAIINPSSSKTVTANHNNPAPREEDVNFKYLKHVLIKFLTSREYEVSTIKTNFHFCVLWKRNQSSRFILSILGSALNESGGDASTLFARGRETASRNIRVENVLVWH